MKNLLNIFVLAAVITLLGGCFSDWAGDDATITIHVGRGIGRAIFPPSDETLAQISYTVALQGPSTMTETFAPGTQTLNLSVTPGEYHITVTAYLDGEAYATGSATAEVRAGQSNTVSITMSYGGKYFTVTFDCNDGSAIAPKNVRDGDTLTKPEDPILDGFVFGGWYLESDTGFPPYDFKVPITDDITIYANWNEPIFDDITNLGEYLSKWSPNTAENPYTVSLKVNDISTLRTTLNANRTKYVDLDLSESTFTNIGDNAFASCTNLTSITIPSSVETIEHAMGVSAFASCTNLTVINVANDNSNYTAENGILYNIAKTTLVAYPPGKTDPSFKIPNTVTSIGQIAFLGGCDSLISITIPSSVTTIGRSAFLGCNSLISVEFETDSNIATADFGGAAFPVGNNVGGDSLKAAYSSATTKAGTYTREENGTTWTKSQ
jgi:uncharacterized repeat protein (TIGR02543 family)